MCYLCATEIRETGVSNTEGVRSLYGSNLADSVLANDNARGKFIQQRLNETDGVFDVVMDIDRLKVSELIHVAEVLKEIDELTGIPLGVTTEVTNATDLIIGHTDVGEAFDVGLEGYDGSTGLSWLHSSGDIYSSWRDSVKVTNGDGSISEYGKWVITHEILHGFGLTHPNDDPYAAGYTQDQTAMSYNWQGVYHGISELDQSALQTLWGV